MTVTSEQIRRVKVRPNYDHVAWKWMRYSALLLGFAMAHGMNGVRQVANDFIKGERARTIMSWALFIFWLAITAIGAAALIGGVRQDFPLN